MVVHEATPEEDHVSGPPITLDRLKVAVHGPPHQLEAVGVWAISANVLDGNAKLLEGADHQAGAVDTDSLQAGVMVPLGSDELAGLRHDLVRRQGGPNHGPLYGYWGGRPVLVSVSFVGIFSSP